MCATPGPAVMNHHAFRRLAVTSYALAGMALLAAGASYLAFRTFGPVPPVMACFAVPCALVGRLADLTGRALWSLGARADVNRRGANPT